MNFSSLLKKHCVTALIQTFPNQASECAALIEITQATQQKFGHYQLNSAMKLSKILNENPRQIAEKLVATLKATPASATLFANIEIAGPGFINFTLEHQFLAKRIHAQLQDPRLGVPTPEQPLKVIIDFSSPNIAKEMHVGHLRSTIIGDCIARVLTFAGHSVLRLNHVGDWGTQFGMLIAHLKTVLPEINNPSPPNIDLSDLVMWYKASKKCFDEDPEFKKQSQMEVVALQSGEENAIRIWKHICTISRKAYQNIYDLLDIDITERGESFYNPYLASVIADLEQKNLLKTSDGAKCIYLEGFTNREGDPLPLILQKSDGAYNYATTDMAALRHRVQDEKGNWLIYVIDSGQSLHLEMVFEAAKLAGYYDPNKARIDHVAFGLVLDAEGKKFKTRSGETERLIDLLETAIIKAREKLLEHNQDMIETELQVSAKILGINAVKYADLSSNRLSDYAFSYEKMLKFEGNTAAFLLYAYVRIRSIQRKVHIDMASLIADNTPIALEEPIEISLGLLICQFSEILDNCTRELFPNRLTDYLFRLAEKFHMFFHQCRVEGSTQQSSRLLLCEAVAQVLHQGIILLGLKPLDRM
jgi:arginyl-tRNA synthetase